jgi:hypothetical protein
MVAHIQVARRVSREAKAQLGKDPAADNWLGEIDRKSAIRSWRILPLLWHRPGRPAGGIWGAPATLRGDQRQGDAKGARGPLHHCFRAS